VHRAGDLFDFEFEVEPILEVLVGKVLEQGLMEVLEEEELAAMRAHQEHFEQLRNAELVAVQRMEAAERRKAEEKDRRLAQVWRCCHGTIGLECRQHYGAIGHLNTMSAFHAAASPPHCFTQQPATARVLQHCCTCCHCTSRVCRRQRCSVQRRPRHGLAHRNIPSSECHVFMDWLLLYVTCPLHLHLHHLRTLVQGGLCSRTCRQPDSSTPAAACWPTILNLLHFGECTSSKPHTAPWAALQ
jgi:hypothetical protein